jgi:uncharacterized protein (DUF433 family)
VKRREYAPSALFNDCRDGNSIPSTAERPFTQDFIMSINLATATKKELKTWAFENLAINLALTMNESTMIDRILVKCKSLNIDPPQNKIETNAAKTTKQKYITVNIAKQPGDGGGEPVFLGVQGKGILVPRGRSIEIPYPYAVCLENARQSIWTQDEEGEMHEEIVYQYPYQTVHGELLPEHRGQMEEAA